MLHLKQQTPTKQHKIHSDSFKWTKKKKISNNGISIKKKKTRCIINNNANHISTSRRWKRKRKRKQRKNSPWSIKQQTYTKTHSTKQIEKTYNKRTKNRTQKHSRAHALTLYTRHTYWANTTCIHTSIHTRRLNTTLETFEHLQTHCFYFYRMFIFSVFC